MKIKTYISVILLNCATFAYSQTPDQVVNIDHLPRDQKFIRQELSSAKWWERGMGAYHIKYLPKGTIERETIEALRTLLKMEADSMRIFNKRFRETRLTITQLYGDSYDGYAEYLADLIEVVRDYTTIEDIESLPVLTDLSDYTHQRIAEFGKPALPKVLARLSDEEQIVRVGALYVLAAWMKPNKSQFVLSGSEREDVKRIFMKSAAEDTSSGVRRYAVDAMGNMGEIDFIPVLERISNQDLYKSMDRHGNVQYPVRESALRAIQKLKGK